jgi:Tfp pilus assembly protein PilZ
MSIVGPRPEVARYIENWSPRIKEKILSMRPGITGYTTTKYWKESLILDSIKDSEHYYLYNLTPEKLRLDEWYVDNWNSFFDIKIMLKTLYRAFSGARKANSISENIEYNGKSTGKVSLKYYRKYPRVPLNTTIYSKSINEPIGYSRDVSLGGMFIDVKESVEPGKMINLRFELPNHPYPIKAIAKIIWNKTKSNPKLINSVGVEFIRISAIERLKLKNYLESSLSNYIKSYSLD